MEQEQDFFSNITPTSGGLIRPGGFAIRCSLSIRIYNPLYNDSFAALKRHQH